MALYLDFPKVIPVLDVLPEEDIVLLAGAMIDAGAGLLEIVWQGGNSFNQISDIQEIWPDVKIGVSRVMRAADISLLAKLHVTYIVSPGLTPSLAVAARQYGISYFPGVQTITDIMQAREQGYDRLTFYPAELAGGASMLRFWAHLFPDVMFRADGQIRETQMANYLMQPNLFSIASDWMAPRPIIEAEEWDVIKELTVRALSQPLSS